MLLHTYLFLILHGFVNREKNISFSNHLRTARFSYIQMKIHRHHKTSPFICQELPGDEFLSYSL